MSDKEEKKRSVQISPGRMKLSQYERQEWVANAPEGCIVDDIKKQDFWALMAHLMKPYDRIEVRADDGSWLAELVVIGCGRNWAKVSVLNHYKLDDASDEMKDDAEYSIAFKGPQKKWCVIRNSDDAYIREGIGSKQEAQAAMEEQKDVAASAA
jgi:hypothetical protein